MVTCTKCGRENEEGAKYCNNCGAALYTKPEDTSERHIERRERHPRDECFGLPNSGAIASIVFGILIILWGLSALFGWEINIMAFVIVIFGVLIIAGAIYRLTRRRS